jgi:hypothetical protein
VGRFLHGPDEMRFGLCVETQIRKRHSKKHAALDRFRIQLARRLQKFNRFLQMSTTLKSHRSREIPGIKVFRALAPHLGVNTLCLIVLVGLVQSQRLFKQIDSLFLIHVM